MKRLMELLKEVCKKKTTVFKKKNFPGSTAKTILDWVDSLIYDNLDYIIIHANTYNL